MQTDLPIHELHHTLCQTWAKHNQIVLSAPTGSGKTTQVCQMLLADWARQGRNADKRIVILQPRRVAARTVARRVAEEMGVALGQTVGYQVRFEDVTDFDRTRTRICFVTEGVLLRWLNDDPLLSDIGAVLFDEFHERNILSDVALAVCKEIQQRRPDLLLVVMSATLEIERVAAYLGNCPMLQSQGRAFPVDIRYQNWSQSWADDAPVWERAAQQVNQILRQTSSGDVLVFMPGAYEISRTMEELRRKRVADEAILPLHGELSPSEQDRAFVPTAQRRVIVATNVAETSVTLPNIHFVVDSGLARVARFDPARGVSALRLEPISQASADQRAGRAGRVAAGTCYRLWAAAEQAKRPIRNTPEIQRADLSEVLLLLKSLGVTNALQFDFLDAPDLGRLQAAEGLLIGLGALDPATKAITELGRRLLRLPLHPRYGRMLIEAQRLGCEDDMALFAAMLSSRDLWVRLDRNDQATRRNREGLLDGGGRGKSTAVLGASDYFALRRAFEFAVAQQFASASCYRHGINPHSAREIAQSYAQIRQIAQTHLSRPADCAATVALDALARSQAVRRCHLAGFVDQLAVRVTSGALVCDLADGRQGELMQESVVGRSQRGEVARLVVVSEIREISTRSGDTLTLLGFASAIEPSWLHDLSPRPKGFVEQVEHVYDRLTKRVVAAEVLRYRDLVLSGTPLPTCDPAEAGLALAREFADKLDRVPAWGQQVLPFLRRGGTLPFALNDYDALVHWLAQAWHGASTYKEIVERRFALPE
ncbi:MAG: helicase-related protein [Anaerolineae bacterium]|nr:helicase-related protein [Anaerolineae bacterium]